MLDEERHFALVIRALQVNVAGHKVRAAAARVVLQSFIDLKSQTVQFELRS